MAEFTDYRTDSVYEINYTKDIAPPLIRLALALQGIAMPEGADGQPFRYLELGFGFGTSLNTHAAANGGEYWGADFMAEHVDFANRLGDAAGVDKHYLRKSFAEMDEMAKAGELPLFDVIAFHGIWSWINAENRQHMLNIVDTCLKPGGVVYNSYNTQPGWSNFMPVRELMRLNGERLGDDRPIEDRVKETLAYTGALADAGAAFFKINPAAGLRLQGLSKMPLHYLAQEYFNTTWRPFYFSEVAETFNGIGCTFASSTNLLQMTGALVPPNARVILASMPNRQFRETLRDFAVNQSFRSDLFVRDPVRLNTREQKKAIDNTKLMRLNPSAKPDLVVSASYGKLALDKQVYGAVLASLEEDGGRPRRIGDIFAKPGLEQLDERVRHEIVSVLAGKLLAWPALEEVAPERADACRKLNRAICEEATKGQTMQTLASSVLGSGIPVANEEMRFLYYRPEGESPDRTEWVRQVVDSHVRQGKNIDFAKAMEKMLPLADMFVRTRLPYFEAAGMTF